MEEENAVALLREAIKKHGNVHILWTLEAPMAEFFEVWGYELGRLEADGDCEIPSKSTVTGNPVVVTISKNPETNIETES